MRLLSEPEVDLFKELGIIIVGQCHAIAEMPALWFCPKQRLPYKRTCSTHRLVRGNLLEAYNSQQGGR